MFKPTVKVSSSNKAPQLMKDVEQLSKMEVYVGIPEAASSRRGEEITNAELVYIHTHGVRAASMRAEMKPNLDAGMGYSAAHALYIHSHGSPLWHIPPRPIIEAAITAQGNKEAIAGDLKVAAKLVLDHDKPGAMRQLQLTGQDATNRIKSWFFDPRNNWAPNAPSTIKEKKSERPLIDTAQLQRAMTWVVAEKK